MREMSAFVHQDGGTYTAPARLENMSLSRDCAEQVSSRRGQCEHDLALMRAFPPRIDAGVLMKHTTWPLTTQPTISEIRRLTNQRVTINSMANICYACVFPIMGAAFSAKVADIDDPEIARQVAESVRPV
jgi:hypothetical protein